MNALYIKVNLSNRPHLLGVYRRDNPREMLGKPIESVVYCFYKTTLSKLCVYGTINHRFLTKKNARTFLVIL